MEKVDILDLENKATELLNKIQSIKAGAKIKHHDISFTDIENLQNTIQRLAFHTYQPNDTIDDKNPQIIHDATDSLWKLRTYLLLDDDKHSHIKRLAEFQKEINSAEQVAEPSKQKAIENLILDNLNFDKKLSEINLGNLLSFIMSDIDIFLLKQEDQLTDKSNSFSVSEIRNQLLQTTSKFSEILHPFLDIPISKAFRLFQILKPHTNTLSENEKKEFIRNLYDNN